MPVLGYLVIKLALAFFKRFDKNMLRDFLPASPSSECGFFLYEDWYTVLLARPLCPGAMKNVIFRKRLKQKFEEKL